MLKLFVTLLYILSLVFGCDAEEAKKSRLAHDHECTKLALHGPEGDKCGEDYAGDIPVDEETKKKKEDEIDNLFPDPTLAKCADNEMDAPLSISGNITSDATWNGIVNLTADATIANGVTITGTKCLRLDASPGTTLNIAGSFLVNGDSKNIVGFNSTSTGSRWGGIRIASGGTMDAKYVFAENADRAFGCEANATKCDISNSTIKGSPYPIHYAGPGTIDSTTMVGMRDKGVYLTTGANVTITNSKMYNPISGDVLGQFGGDLVIDKSEVGTVGAGADYEHCAIHITSGNSLSVTNSILTANAYAIMLGAIDGAVFRHNNFVESQTQHFLKVGAHTNTVLDDNYWEGGAQAVGSGDFTGTNSTITNDAGSPHADVGSSL